METKLWFSLLASSLKGKRKCVWYLNAQRLSSHFIIIIIINVNNSNPELETHTQKNKDQTFAVTSVEAFLRN